MYKLSFEKKANDDIALWKRSGNKKALEKLNDLLEELIEHPKTGIGQPEELRNNYSGLWSRHITKKDRLVYRIKEDIVEVLIVQAKGHYGDK